MSIKPLQTIAVVGLASLGFHGCSNPGERWRLANDSAMAKTITPKEMGDDRGLLARWLTPKATPPGTADKPVGLILGRDGWEPPKFKPDPQAEAEFASAEKIFQQGDFGRAEPIFKSIAKKRKDTPWGEKASFYLAETRYQRGNFVGAHDAFERLVADYPGTLFLEKVVAREYDIAQAWLIAAEPAKPKTDKDKADRNAKSDDAIQKTTWTDHFTGRLPLVDTSSSAIQALEHVRKNDPLGPLSDDAVMKIAHHFEAKGDYETASLYYDQVTVDHPKSEFLQQAQLSAVEMRMRGYLGPEYDGEGLEQARELVKQTMSTFPDRPEGDEDLLKKLDLINAQDAERTYAIGAYYRRIGKVPAAEYYFGKIVRRWPKSPYADKSKKQLATLAKMPRTKSVPSKIMSQPGANDPYSASAGGQNPAANLGGMGGMGGMN